MTLSSDTTDAHYPCGALVALPESAIRGPAPTEAEFRAILKHELHGHPVSCDTSQGTVQQCLQFLGNEVELLRRLGHALSQKQDEMETELRSMRAKLLEETRSHEESNRNLDALLASALTDASHAIEVIRKYQNTQGAHGKAKQMASKVPSEPDKGKSRIPSVEPRRTTSHTCVPEGFKNDSTLNSRIPARLGSYQLCWEDAVASSKLDQYQSRVEKAREEAQRPPLAASMSSSSTTPVDPAMDGPMNDGLKADFFKIVDQVNLTQEMILDAVAKYGSALNHVKEEKQSQEFFIEGWWKKHSEHMHTALRIEDTDKCMQAALGWMEAQLPEEDRKAFKDECLAQEIATRKKIHEIIHRSKSSEGFNSTTHPPDTSTSGTTIQSGQEQQENAAFRTSQALSHVAGPSWQYTPASRKDKGKMPAATVYSIEDWRSGSPRLKLMGQITPALRSKTASASPSSATRKPATSSDATPSSNNLTAPTLTSRLSGSSTAPSPAPREPIASSSALSSCIAATTVVAGAAVAPGNGKRKRKMAAGAEDEPAAAAKPVRRCRNPHHNLPTTAVAAPRNNKNNAGSSTMEAPPSVPEAEAAPRAHDARPTHGKRRKMKH